MFDYLQMAYEDSDYTIMITIMNRPKRIILVLKLTLVVEVQALLSSHRLSGLLDCSLQLSLPLRKAHKDSDHTVVIAVAHVLMLMCQKLTLLVKL